MKKIIPAGNQFGIILLFVLPLLFGRCNTGYEDNSSMVIGGKIDMPVSGKIYFYAAKDTGDLYDERKSAIDSSLIDKDGKYSIILHGNYPYSFNLMIGNTDMVTNLFICPGDRMTLNFTGKNNTPQFSSSNEVSKFNSYLVNFQDSFYKNSTAKEEYYIINNYMDGSHFETYNELRKQYQLDFYKSYFGDETLRKEYRDYALNVINYGIAVDRLIYLWKKRMKGQKVVIDSTYFNFETQSFIENKDAFLCPSYIRFLNLYIKDTFERMVESGELPLDKTKNINPAVEKFILTERLLNRPYRDVVLYSILRDDLNENDEAGKTKHISVNSLDSLTDVFKKKYMLN